VSVEVFALKIPPNDVGKPHLPTSICAVNITIKTNRDIRGPRTIERRFSTDDRVSDRQRAGGAEAGRGAKTPVKTMILAGLIPEFDVAEQCPVTVSQNFAETARAGSLLLVEWERAPRPSV
jgi:hypothetical protein